MFAWLESTGLSPHGFCLLWQPGLIWTHALADTAIAAAYFTIPLALATFVRRRRDLGFRPILLLFAAFILLCGAGHLVDVATLWIPVYGVQAVVKVATAVVSVATAILLWRLLPAALSVPSPAQLRAVNVALQESEQRHRTRFQRAPIPLHELDADHVITGVSDRWLELMGYEREEVVGQTITRFIEPGTGDGFPSDWQTVLAQGELSDVPRRFVRRDGAVLDVLVSARREVAAGSGRVVVLGAVIDVTDRRRAELALRASEERLAQTQRLEALGQLTGGVAHDFNNVLQGIVGSLDLIRRRAADRVDGVVPEASAARIDRLAVSALAGAHRAATLTAQLLSFARQQRLDPKPLDVAEVVDGMATLLHTSLGQGITWSVEAAPDSGLCLADRSQLEAALLNVAINARDAMDGVGTLRIAVSRALVDEGSPEPKRYVRISVADDGAGMPDEVRRRAFEPFFTTKPVGSGTGLGLAQVHGFANQSGGNVEIDSAPGRGTEIVILLPAAAPSAMPSHRPVEEAYRSSTHVGTRRLLLVDDDELVRNALAEALQERSFAVRAVSDAEAALEALSREPFDAMLSDLSMPGALDGLGLARAVRELGLDLPIVLATGHLDPFRNHALPRGVTFVQKPCEVSSLAATLEREVQREAMVTAAQ